MKTLDQIIEEAYLKQGLDPDDGPTFSLFKAGFEAALKQTENESLYLLLSLLKDENENLKKIIAAYREGFERIAKTAEAGIPCP